MNPGGSKTWLCRLARRTSHAVSQSIRDISARERHERISLFSCKEDRNCCCDEKFMLSPKIKFEFCLHVQTALIPSNGFTLIASTPSVCYIDLSNTCHCVLNVLSWIFFQSSQSSTFDPSTCSHFAKIAELAKPSDFSERTIIKCYRRLLRNFQQRCSWLCNKRRRLYRGGKFQRSISGVSQIICNTQRYSITAQNTATQKCRTTYGIRSR
jgi:hypothetical protein